MKIEAKVLRPPAFARPGRRTGALGGLAFVQALVLWPARAIEEIAAAIAKVLGFAGAAQFDEALDAVRDGKSALPLVPGMVDDMAPEALFQLLGKEHSLALAALLDAEANALAGLKRDVLAERSRHRARALEALARAVAGGSTPSGSPSPR